MYQIRPTGLITRNDLPPHEVPAEFLTDVQNVSFRDVFPERVRGFRPIYDANVTIGSPLFLLPNVFQGTNYWIYGCDNEVGVTDSAGVHTDLSPVSGAPSAVTSDQWTGCELNGFPVLNWQSTGGPHSWNRSVGSNVAPLVDWPSGYSCGAIRSFKNFLIALNIAGAVDWPSVALWSDSAAPGNLPDDGAGTTWTATAHNDAGSLSFGDTGTGITDGLGLRDDFMVYKTNSTHAMEYLEGSSLIFGQRELFRTIGALATNCVTEWQGHHIVFGDGDVVIHDGNQVRSLIDKVTRRKLYSELSQEHFARSFVVNHKNQNEVFICYPTEGDTYPTKVLVWDANSDTTKFKDTIDIFGGLSFRDCVTGGSGTPHMAHGNISTSGASDAWSAQVATWATTNRSWDEFKVRDATDGLVAIDTDADELVEFDIGNSYSTGTLNASLTRESLDMGDAEQVKLVTEVLPRITGTKGDIVSIRIGSQMTPDETITWSPYQTFRIGEDQKIYTFARGRYISIEVISSGGSVWRCTGFDFTVRFDGVY